MEVRRTNLVSPRRREGDLSSWEDAKAIAIDLRNSLAETFPPGSTQFKVAAGLLASVILLASFLASQYTPEFDAETYYGRPVVGELNAGALLDEKEVESDGKFDMIKAYRLWKDKVGCAAFRRKHKDLIHSFRNPQQWPHNPSMQSPNEPQCSALKLRHVSVYFPPADEQTWLDGTLLEGYHFCPRCRITCQLTWADAMASRPDAALYVAPFVPPGQRDSGDPLRVYLDMRPPLETQSAPPHELLVSYSNASVSREKDERVDEEHHMQLTFASFADSFAQGRNHDTHNHKFQDVLLRWHPTKCNRAEDIQLGTQVISALESHVFGECASANLTGTGDEGSLHKNMCMADPVHDSKHQKDNCFSSMYKFELVVESSRSPSFVTWDILKTFTAGTLAVYFGPPDASQFLPPHSFVDAASYGSTVELVEHLMELHRDPVKYMEYFAWRNCGVFGHFQHSEALGFRNLPCRLCEKISALGGRLH